MLATLALGLLASPASALPGYPLVAAVDAVGTPICDVDSPALNPAHTDIACSAVNSVYSAYLGADATTVTARWTLRGDPQTGGGSGPLSSAHWTVIVKNGAGTTLAGFGIDGKNSGVADVVYVQCAPAGATTYTKPFTAALADGTAAVGTTAGGLFQLSAVVPLSALASCGITATTPVRLTFATATSGLLYEANKDDAANGAALPLVQLSGDLNLVKTATLVSGPNPPTVGSTTTYDLTIAATNASFYVVNGVSVSDVIPAGVTIVGVPTADDGSVSVAAQTVTWSDFALAGADTDTLTIRVSVTPAAGQVGTAIALNAGAPGSGSRADGTTVSDTSNAVSTAPVVGGANTAPNAVDDAATVAEGSGAAAINVLANDTDPESNPLTVTAVSQPADGSATFTAAGVTFTPDAGFNGVTSFTYTVADGNGGTDTASVTVTVTPVNDPPVAADDAVTVAEEAAATVVDVLGNDTDPEGDALAVTAVTQPADGSATFTAAGVTFTPDAGFNGVTSFTYTVADGNGGTDTASVTVTVTSVNDPPVAADDVLGVGEDSGATVDVLGNDTDPEGDALAVTAVTQPAAGTGTASLVGGVVGYAPPADFEGSATFTYTVADGNGGTDTASVTVTVTPVNDPPVAIDDALSVGEDSGASALNVLGNDTDVEGELLAVTAATQPAAGTGSVNLTGGVLLYTPPADFAGTATFSYTISDGTDTDTASVTVTVTPVNDPPVAGDDALSVGEDSGASAVNVLGNDTDVEGDLLAVTAVTQPAAGTGTASLVGGVVGYAPPADFAGSATFTYTVADGNGGTDTAAVTVTVTPVNDPPVAIDDAATTDEDVPVLVDVLGNDSDVEGELLSLATPPTATTQGGSLACTAAGRCSYLAPNGFVGTDTFSYAGCDLAGGCDDATVTVTVMPVNDVPVAADDLVNAASGGAVDVDVLGNDVDADGDALEVASFTQGEHGTVTQNSDGTLHYVADQGFNGVDAFTYTVCDAAGACATATAQVVVAAAGAVRPPDQVAPAPRPRPLPVLGAVLPRTGTSAHTASMLGLWLLMSGVVLSTAAPQFARKAVRPSVQV